MVTIIIITITYYTKLIEEFYHLAAGACPDHLEHPRGRVNVVSDGDGVGHRLGGVAHVHVRAEMKDNLIQYGMNT